MHTGIWEYPSSRKKMSVFLLLPLCWEIHVSSIPRLMLQWLVPKPQLWVWWDLSFLYPSLGYSLSTVFSNSPGRIFFFSFLSGHSFPTWFSAVLCKALIDHEHRYMLDWNPSLILSLVLSVPLCKMKTISSVDKIMLEQSEWGAWGKITRVPVFLSVRSVQRRCRRSLCGGEIEGLKGVMRGMWGSSQS